MKLSLPLPPNLANSRLHWRRKNKAKKAYWRKLDMLVAAKKLPKPPRKAFDPARITVKLFVWNLCDQDNAMARLKWLLDWLVGNDYLGDDNPKRLEWAGLPEQEIDRKRQRVEVTLERADKEAA